MNSSIVRMGRQSHSLWKRLSINHHVNPLFYVSAYFSVRTKMFESTHQVPKDQQVNRLKEGHQMATTRDSALVKEAAKQMIDARIGALLVVDTKDDHEIVGVVTERDCMRAISNTNSLNDCIIKDIMTSSEEIISAKNNISSEDCFKIMLQYNIRHLPLVDDDFVICRMLSIKDVAASMISENDRKIHEKEEEAEYWAWRAQNLDESPGSYMSH